VSKLAHKIRYMAARFNDFVSGGSSAVAAGSSSVNAEPTPTSLSTWRSPPMARARSR